MLARDPSEGHRPATPLELFFDLCFVVAVALAASNLHHEVAEDHVWDGVLNYAMVFFAIWWAWMNFTWFASAFDTDDGLYRVTTFVQMAGVLVMAAGIPRAFESTDLGLVTAGYVVMRLAMVTQWLRVARTTPSHRTTALRFAFGVTAVQVLWVLRLLADGDFRVITILPLVACEMMVPIFAERAGATPWHPRHLGERYGLFTLLVLGESILAATIAFQVAFDEGFNDGGLISLAIAALVIVFSMWWLYFDEARHPEPGTSAAAFVWGYGHLPIFAAVAAVGAGLAVAVDHETGASHTGETTTALATTVPIALYLLGVWFLHALPTRADAMIVVLPAGAVAVIAASLTSIALPLAAAILATLVVIMVATPSRLKETPG
jgi:low temperature requirement protein LtrA